MSALEFLAGLGPERAAAVVKEAIIVARRLCDDSRAAEMSALKAKLKRKFMVNKCECGSAIGRKATRCAPCYRRSYGTNPNHCLVGN